MTILLDTREPDPHPWAQHLPDGWRIETGTLETGDLALARLPDGIVIERKTPPDLAGCIGASRERFERELKRSRYCGRFIVVVEGDLRDVCAAARGIHPNAVVGTVAAWTTRYCPIVFAGSVESAANFSFRCLAGQVKDIQRSAGVSAAIHAHEVSQLLFEHACRTDSHMISARLSEHTRALTARFTAEESYRKELQHRKVLIDKVEAFQTARQAIEAVLKRLRRMPIEIGPQCNPQEPLRATKIMQREVDEVISAGSKEIHAIRAARIQ